LPKKVEEHEEEEEGKGGLNQHVGSSVGGSSVGVDGAALSPVQRSDATCAAQIAFADRLVLNKVDLIATPASGGGSGGSDDGKGRLAELLELVHGLNPLAEVCCTTKADVPLEWVLDIHAYDTTIATTTALPPPPLPPPPASLPTTQISASLSDCSSSVSSDVAKGPLRTMPSLKPWQQHLVSTQQVPASSFAPTSSFAANFPPASPSLPPASAPSLEQQQQLRHPVGVSSLSIVREGVAVDQTKLEAWLAEILWSNEETGDKETGNEDDCDKDTQQRRPQGRQLKESTPFGFLGMDIFRMKGVVAVIGKDYDEDTEKVASLSSAPSLPAYPLTCAIETSDTAASGFCVEAAGVPAAAAAGCLSGAGSGVGNISGRGVGADKVRAFKHVLQAVHGLFELTESGERWESDDQNDEGHRETAAGGISGRAIGGGCGVESGGGASESGKSRIRVGSTPGVRLVVIGRHLDRRRLERGLDACCLPLL